MKKSPLARESKKKKASKKAAADVRRDALERDNHSCQFRHQAYGVLDHTQVPASCRGELEWHHIIPRSVWPGGVLVLDNTIMLCVRHHAWVGDNPNDAALVGLHDWSWGRRGVDDA